MQRVNKPDQYQWQLRALNDMGLFGVPRAAELVSTICAEHSRDGRPCASDFTKRAATMNNFVWKRHENLLRTTIALVGGELQALPRSRTLNDGPRIIAVYRVLAPPNPKLKTCDEYWFTETGVMYLFCRVNDLIDFRMPDIEDILIQKGKL